MDAVTVVGKQSSLNLFVQLHHTLHEGVCAVTQDTIKLLHRL